MNEGRGASRRSESFPLTQFPALKQRYKLFNRYASATDEGTQRSTVELFMIRYAISFPGVAANC